MTSAKSFVFVSQIDIIKDFHLIYIAVVTCRNEFSCVILLLSSTADFQAIILQIFQLILILTYPSPKPTFALSEN